MVERCLEIGPGRGWEPPDERWESLDILPGATYQCDLASEPIPADDGRFSKVMMSHVIEHVPWYRTDECLHEVRRVMARGGVLDIYTLDFGIIVDAWKSGTIHDQWRRYNLEGDIHRWICGRLYAYGAPDEGDQNWHRAIFTPESLEDCLLKAGFSGIVPIGRKPSPHGPVEFGLRAANIRA